MTSGASERNGTGAAASAKPAADAERPPAILVVDDEQDLASACAFFFERAGYRTATASSGDAALAELERGDFSVVVSDIRMPRMSGIALLDAIRERDPDVEVILITGHPEVESAVRAIKQGAFDYLQKPFDEPQLMQSVEKALRHRALKDRNVGFRDRLRSGVDARLCHRSAEFARTVHLIERAARTDASVLIQGESGTGKELLAHHLHQSSERSDKPFVPVDCTTMPESLVESELFGHVKGAFSGAVGNKMGLFQVADGGTLFLDEIGELPLSFQPKLLRAIQERQIRRVGGTDTIDVDVRIVCATNRNLAKEVEAGRFRQDLFYRLDVVRIDVPPLRVRPDDIEVLAEHFLREFANADPSCTVRGFTADALRALKAHEWPGNVRQLRNAIERACTLGTSTAVGVEDLPLEVIDAARTQAVVDVDLDRALGTFQEMKARKVAAIESTYVQELLRRHGGNVTRCAEEAGMSRSAFQKLMQRYSIRSSDFRP